MFNIAEEPGPNELPGEFSPAYTKWAPGTTADLNTGANLSGTLYADSFVTLEEATQDPPPVGYGFGGTSKSLGLPFVMYLTKDDIYLDVMFLSVTTNSNKDCDDWPAYDPEDLPPYACGGFSWLRASGTDSTIDTVNDSPFTPVPIPGALWLFGSGLLGLAGLARKKAAT